ncbi:MAG: hypothetical protein FJ398_19540 [Verrucomicrobia bacterium]|nr:hypothetical protein [Verrucomicrobiota bacterium]
MKNRKMEKRRPATNKGDAQGKATAPNVSSATRAVNPADSNVTAASEADSQAVLRQLTLARRYWLETVHRFIAGRKLSGPELAVADHAWNRLRDAVWNAEEWNRILANGSPGTPIPDDEILNLEAPEFARPDAASREGLEPGQLAALAAALMPKKYGKLSRDQAVREAHELLVSAERYISGLPKNAPSVFERSRPSAHGTVRISEIEESQESGGLPLLYKLTKRTDKENRAMTIPLSRDAIVKAVHDYLEGMRLPKNDMDSHLKQGRVTVADLCALRWKRFRSQAEKQMNRAETGKAKAQMTRAENKRKAEEARKPASAASTQVYAGIPEVKADILDPKRRTASKPTRH